MCRAYPNKRRVAGFPRRLAEIATEAAELRAERPEAGNAGKRFIAAIGDDHDRELKAADEIEETGVAGRRRVEHAARLGPHRVAAPAEIAEGEVGAGMRGHQGRLDRAPFPLALDDRVAEEDDPVTGMELEARPAGRLCGAGAGPRPQRHGEEQLGGQRQETARPRTRWRGHGGRFRSGGRGGSVAFAAGAGGVRSGGAGCRFPPTPSPPSARIPESHP